MDKGNTVCFTGHRRYDGGGRGADMLDSALEAAYRNGFRIFVSGMAEGFDLAAAEAVARLRELHLGVLLVAAVPFAGQAAGYGAADREKYESLLSVADRTFFLEGRYSHGCYFRRDDWMIERSSRVICWYDGSDGGTRYTVRRALAAGIGVVNLYIADGTLF